MSYLLCIVIGWDCGISNRNFLVSLQMVESPSSCICTNLVFQLHWRRKKNSCLCKHYISLLWTWAFTVTHHTKLYLIYEHFQHPMYVKSSWLHCDHFPSPYIFFFVHFRSPYIFFLHGCLGTDSGQRTHGGITGMPLKNFWRVWRWFVYMQLSW